MANKEKQAENKEKIGIGRCVPHGGGTDQGT